MHAFRWTFRVLALIPLVTGLLEVAMGLGSLGTLGVPMSRDALTHASADSGWRFLGAVWAGYAVLIWYATTDLVRNAGLMRILLGALFFSGIARAISVWQLGWPVAPFVAAMLLELIGMPLAWWWLRRLLAVGQG